MCLPGNVLVRPMLRTELDWAVGLAAQEGWNPGLHDAEAFWAQDPGAFLIAETDGEALGCISAVRYEGKFGFMGFYIVCPKHRAKGYGMALWRAAVERLGDGVIGLDGVFEQQENYRESGFEFAYRNIRYEYCLKRREANADMENFSTVSAGDWVDLFDFDTKHFGYPRPHFLRAWLAISDAIKRIQRDVSGKIQSFCMARPCVQGWKIGPLFATNPDSAFAALNDVFSLLPEGVYLYLDVPEVNGDAMELAKFYGMEGVFGTARMYKNGVPSLPVENIFGVTTFELG